MFPSTIIDDVKSGRVKLRIEIIDCKNYRNRKSFKRRVYSLVDEHGISNRLNKKYLPQLPENTIVI